MHWLFVANCLCFFVYSRKVNDNNDSVDIRMEKNNFFLSRDYTETLNMSESSSSAELSIDDKIRPSGSNEMRFVNSEEVRCNHRLCDERRCEKEYTWLYYNFDEKGCLCKSCEVFYGESNAKPGGNRGYGRIMLLSLKIILVKKTNT